MAGKEKVGVELVVSELSKFLSNMGKADSGIRSIIPTTGLLGTAFNTLWDIGKGIARFVANTLAHAFGELLADAIQAVVAQIKELITNAIEAADTFQRLQIRLERLNFNEIKSGYEDMEKAQAAATAMTQEQLAWALKLGATTPYDTSDIAEVYTMARAYGLTADEARDTTDAVLQFGAGMALTGEEMQRIMINFGQMMQQGKLNGQDLRDLGRGAFLPINKLLGMTAEKLGMTVEEFNRLRKAGKLGAEGVTAFRESFMELTGMDFKGAAQALGSVFGVAVRNIKALISESLAMYVIGPVLYQIGSYLQAITDALALDEGRWSKFTDALGRIGDAILGIISDLIGLAPDAEVVADGIVNAFEAVATWIETNRETIVSFIRDTVIPALQDFWIWLFGGEVKDESTGKITEVRGAVENFITWAKTAGIPALEKFWGWVFGEENKETGEVDTGALGKIMEIINALSPAIPPFMELLGALGDVIMIAFGGTETQTFAEFVKTTLIPAIEGWTQYIIDNKDNIAEWLTFLLKAYLVISLVAGIIQWFIGIIMSLAGFVLSLALTWQGLVAAGAFLVKIFLVIAGAISLPIIAIVALIASIALLAYLIYNYGSQIWTTITQLASIVAMSFQMMGYVILGFVKQAIAAIYSWATQTGAAVSAWGASVASNITGFVNNAMTAISGWASGMVTQARSMATQFVAAIESMKTWAVERMRELVDRVTSEVAKLPGKFLDIGKQAIKSMAQGILSGIGAVVDAAAKAAESAMTAAQSALSMHSPSKVFIEIGENTMKSMAMGIGKMAGLAASEMQSAMMRVSSQAAMIGTSAPLVAAPSTTTNTSNTYNNLTINTSARSEPIIQDFYMMQSLGA